MGMFDTVVLVAKCPYCGLYSEMEFQTKDLHCRLDVYKKWDSIGNDKYKYLDVTGECHSPQCQERADKRDITYQDVPSGFGALFYAKVEVEEGRITGKIYDIQKNDNLSDEYLNEPKNKKKIKELYKPRKEDNWTVKHWEKAKRNSGSDEA